MRHDWDAAAVQAALLGAQPTPWQAIAVADVVSCGLGGNALGGARRAVAAVVATCRAEEAGTVDARLALGRSAALEDHRGGGGSVGRRATARAATPAIRAQQCGAHRLSTKIVDVNTQRVAEAQQGKAAVGPALLPSWFRDRPVVWWMLTEVDGSRGPQVKRAMGDSRENGSTHSWCDSPETQLGHVS